MHKTIGGMFGLDVAACSNSCLPWFLEGRNLKLVNARSGISLLIAKLSPPAVWLPSYLCDSILKAIGKCPATMRFYEVGYDLAITSDDWIGNVQHGDIVLLIDYFGFPCERGYVIKLRERGAWILEDASQALLSGDVGRAADFVLFSPRKFLGVPDGGILKLNSDVHLGVDLQLPPAKWWLEAFYAAVLRREFDGYGHELRWSGMFQKTEAQAPVGDFAMSELTELLLAHAFDYTFIGQRRSENYQSLSERLRDLALFPDLPSAVVPLGFPIRIKKRDHVRQRLFAHHIYPPVHWALEGVAPEEFRESHRLASEIMTLPCDQRYDKNDMARMARLVRRSVEA